MWKRGALPNCPWKKDVHLKNQSPMRPLKLRPLRFRHFKSFACVQSQPRRNFLCPWKPLVTSSRYTPRYRIRCTPTCGRLQRPGQRKGVAACVEQDVSRFRPSGSNSGILRAALENFQMSFSCPSAGHHAAALQKCTKVIMRIDRSMFGLNPLTMV
jgi:hypothetical protein